MEKHEHTGITLLAVAAFALALGLLFGAMLQRVSDLDDMRDRISVLEGTPVAEEQE